MIKKYDLEERTRFFARSVIDFTRGLPRTTENLIIIKQLVRSATSTEANYVEANEALSTKDYYYRVKICRKEVKESVYWMKLIILDDLKKVNQLKRLINEAVEIMNIFGLIIRKGEKKT